MADHVIHENHIYILGLPRKALFDLFNLFDYGDDRSHTEFFRIFGGPSYTFSMPGRLQTAAPLREFGSSSVKRSQRISFFKSLPPLFKEYLITNYPDHQLGYFVDESGRKYKLEDKANNRWSVLLPITRKTDEKVEFPVVGDKIKLRHVHRVDTFYNYEVSEIGGFKKASATIYLI